ncbi:hypothetical protein Lesp02_14080 [Lentzea sp. NBRC 105346]|nr:hypothetical protein Lesp02_14080 [Lentzea sp. NBRC 105346]
MPSWNRTASRAWRTQYSAVNRSTGAPVRLEITGIRGGAYGIPAATSRKSSSIGSMCGEWNARVTRNRLVRCPRASKTAAIAVTASSSPEITVAAGPFTAAMLSAASCPASSGCTSSSLADTESIAPRAGRARINRPRAATSAHASAASRTPATCAAASSPIEWPSRAPGRTPQCSNNRNSATSKANSAACA